MVAQMEHSLVVLKVALMVVKLAALWAAPMVDQSVVHLAAS